MNGKVRREAGTTKQMVLIRRYKTFQHQKHLHRIRLKSTPYPEGHHRSFFDARCGHTLWWIFHVLKELKKSTQTNHRMHTTVKDITNLYLRLVKYKDSELLFLRDRSVPANNSLAERPARVYKRKQRQATVLRSDNSFEYLCYSLGLIYTIWHAGCNLEERVSNIFNRKRYQKKR